MLVHEAESDMKERPIAKLICYNNGNQWLWLAE